ncbi:MAG: carbonic anhydrase [Deltaproteobacteria bacterium]|nr:carbonic anhydrase [Deltaproteobacteria bacterium]
MIRENPAAPSCNKSFKPEIHAAAYVHPLAVVIGHVRIGKSVMICPFASVRADEGHPFFIGDQSNIQDGVIIHALETEWDGKFVEENHVTFRGQKYAVYVGRRVSIAHQAQVHGPALIGDDTFIGMKALLFRSTIGRHCVVEPGAVIMNVKVPDHRFVPAGAVIKDRLDSDALPHITKSYPLKDMNAKVVKVNTSLAAAYNRSGVKP